MVLWNIYQIAEAWKYVHPYPYVELLVRSAEHGLQQIGSRGGIGMHKLRCI